MVELYAYCPRRNQVVFADIRVDAGDRKPQPFFHALTRCPACGDVHKWTADDVWVLHSEPIDELVA